MSNTYTPGNRSQTSQIARAMSEMIHAGESGGTVWGKVGANPTALDLAVERGAGWVVGGVVVPLVLKSVDVANHPSGFGSLARWLELEYFEIGSSDGVGFWVDSDDGSVWFDVVEVYPSRRMAMHAARKSGEKEIFNVISGECEPVE
jgi:hypothetical protein